MNLKLHQVTSSTYHSRLLPTSLQPTIPVRCLLFPSTILIYRSHQKFSTAILKCPSTVLHHSAINRKGQIHQKLIKKNTLNHEMKICFFQIFKSSFSQPFLTMASSFSTPSNQYCFIIGLRSTLSWLVRNPFHNIIVVLRSKQILFLPLTTKFVHKITHNKVCVVVPCFLRLGWLGSPSPAETLVPKLRAPVCLSNCLVFQQK